MSSLDDVAAIAQSLHFRRSQENKGPATIVNLPQRPETTADAVARISNRMHQQWQAHQDANHSTQVIFHYLLGQLHEWVRHFESSLTPEMVPDLGDAGNIRVEVDPDQSVAILHLMWHHITFVCRGNNTPMAFQGQGMNQPMFCGRILALGGDFLTMQPDAMMGQNGQDIDHWLAHEIASLYVPGDPNQPAIMAIPHSAERHSFPQQDAARRFLVKTMDRLTHGGTFHEQ